MKNPKNISLIIGFSIPILMIVLVAASIYLPGMFGKSQNNFLYTTGQDDYKSPSYDSSGSHLTVKCSNYEGGTTYMGDKPIAKINCLPDGAGKLFIYDVATNTNREITYDEAQLLILDTNVTSQDGYQVVGGSYGGDIFSMMFGGGGDYNYRDRYLKGHNVSKKLNIQTEVDTYSSYHEFRFLGWIRR